MTQSNSMNSIRPNIRKLKKYCTAIRACNTFSDFFNLMFAEQNSKELKGAFGENFFDQFCIEYEKQSGFAELRPATEAEDTENGCDAVGTLYSTRAKAYRQDKAFSRGFLKVKHIGSFASFKSLKENKDAVFVICTTLRRDQISPIILKTFSPEENGYIIARDNFETTIDEDTRFFERFADRVEESCLTLDSLKQEKLKKEFIKLKDYQKRAVRHAVDRDKSFICLPPGSGKTVIQSEIAANWLRENKNLLVYVAPTLTLLDQNASKIIKYCYDAGVDFTPVFACSIKDTSVTDLEHDGFLEKEDIIKASASSEEVENAIKDCEVLPIIIFTTYASYSNIVKTCKKVSKGFYRIADEVLEVVPTKDIKGYEETAKDKHEHNSRWEVFADNSVIKQSVCFDAFQAKRNTTNEGGTAPGTDNIDVFGEKFFISFGSMKDLGTIIPLKIRAISLTGNAVASTKEYHQEGWTKDDIFNFTALCYTIDHVIQDKTINNKKIVAFLHSAGICPKYLEPITRYVREKLEYVGALISDESKNEECRSDTLDNYRNAKHALVMNYGILGKGIDDDATTVAFCARRMDHPYGMHGIHRPCRTLKEEFNVKNKSIKPCGYVYVVVDEDELGSTEQYKDLCSVYDKLYEQTGEWATDIEVVKLVDSKNKVDACIEKPTQEFKTTPIELIPELYDLIKVKQRDRVIKDSRSISGKSILLQKMLDRDSSTENYLGTKL